MRTKAAIKHYGNRARVAAILGISRAAVSKWGAVVPAGSAIQLEALSDGALRVIPSLYENKQNGGAASERRTAPG